jgi:hypothetical protein
MKSCPRKILLIFGILLIFAFLFIPYRSTHVKYKTDYYSLAKYKLTTHKSGYMFVFKYLKLKSNKRSIPGTEKGIDQETYVLNKTMFLIEMIIVVVLAPLDYFIFCVVLRKRKLGQKNTL